MVLEKPRGFPNKPGNLANSLGFFMYAEEPQMVFGSLKNPGVFLETTEKDKFPKNLKGFFKKPMVAKKLLVAFFE